MKRRGCQLGARRNEMYARRQRRRRSLSKNRWRAGAAAGEGIVAGVKIRPPQAASGSRQPAGQGRLQVMGAGRSNGRGGSKVSERDAAGVRCRGPGGLTRNRPRRPRAEAEGKGTRNRAKKIQRSGKPASRRAQKETREAGGVAYAGSVVGEPEYCERGTGIETAM